MIIYAFNIGLASSFAAVFVLLCSLLAAASTASDLKDIQSAYTSRNYQLTIELATKLLARGPNVTALAFRARARGALGDFNGEIADDNAIIVLDARNADAYVDRGIARGRLGDWNAEIADDGEALAIDGAALANGAKSADSLTSSPNVNRVAAYVNRGAARGHRGDFQGDIDDESAALAIDSKSVDAYVNRGVASGRLGNWNGEIADESAAISIAARLLRPAACCSLATSTIRMPCLEIRPMSVTSPTSE